MRVWRGLCVVVCGLSLLLSGSRVFARVLESPAHGALVSGIGFISGWKCDAGTITVRLDGGGHIPMATEQPRADTRLACGTVDNGFITQVNWNHLSAGTHTAVAYDDGVEFARSTFTVGTADEEFLEGVEAECLVPDFPAPGENGRFVWNESTQHLELAEAGSHIVIPPTTTAPSLEDVLAQHLAQYHGTWDMVIRYTYPGCTHHPTEYVTFPVAPGDPNVPPDTSNGYSIVDFNGYLEASFPLQPGGRREVSLSGRLFSRSASGTWFNNQGCGGTWTATKR